MSRSESAEMSSKRLSRVDDYRTVFWHHRYCSRQHPTYSEMARHIWHQAVVIGDGPYVVLCRCEDPTTVSLWSRAEDARSDRSCHEQCIPALDHSVIELHLPRDFPLGEATSGAGR